MIQYQFTFPNPSSQYIHISVTFDSFADIELIQLPSWRPGRYELGNFAKNVRSFKVYDENNNALDFKKKNKDCWEIQTNKGKNIKISYAYYANELNAGSTFFSDKQVYVNPVNCCVYVVGREGEDIQVELDIPKDFQIATSLTKKNNSLFATNFDELADSPFICSNTLQVNTYEIDSVTFYIWFQGEVRVDWELVLKDFEKFSRKQIEKFGDFPVDQFHFLIQIVPFRAYHGVEHCKSTVLLLGPSHSIFTEFYTDLLGVSSHELYHTWNVKAIRPIEMYPYDFTKENYSELGYICEGVTTYMGDIFLYKSGVFSKEQFFLELNAQLQKHFDNPARFNYSVAESSFDTWLDGYVLGAPGRKVSIYTEGCLLALCTDIKIIEASDGEYSLDDVMKYLYQEFYKKGRGVSRLDYQTAVEKFSKTDMTSFFETYFYSTTDFKPLLVESLSFIGLTIKETPSSKPSISKLGLKTQIIGNYACVKAIYPGSPAENAGLILEDEIIAINRKDASLDIDKWLEMYKNDKQIEFLIKRKGGYFDIALSFSEDNFYSQYSLIDSNDKSEKSNKLFDKWIK